MSLLPTGGPVSPWIARRADRGAPAAASGSVGLADDLDAHRAGGPFDLAHRRFDVVGVEVGHLGLGDLLELGAGDLAHLLALRRARALVEAGRLLQKVPRRRGLEDEAERAI